mgnify:CR=1 FL=1
MDWLRSFLGNQSGNAATEMALSLPMVMALLFGCFEGGHYLYVEHQVTKGVRDGARFAARQPFSKFTCSSVDATLASQVKEITRTGVINGGSPRVAGWDNSEVFVTASCPAVAVTTGIYANLTNAPVVTVRARVPYPSLFSSLGGLTSTTVVGSSNQAPVVGI